MTQCQRQARIRVRQTGPPFGNIYAVQESIQSFPFRRTHDLLTIYVVTNVRIRIVEGKRYIANCVLCLVTCRIFRVIIDIDLVVNISFIAGSVRLDFVVWLIVGLFWICVAFRNLRCETDIRQDLLES